MTGGLGRARNTQTHPPRCAGRARMMRDLSFFRVWPDHRSCCEVAERRGELSMRELNVAVDGAFNDKF
jgi:hypothetical protein